MPEPFVVQPRPGARREAVPDLITAVPSMPVQAVLPTVPVSSERRAPGDARGAHAFVPAGSERRASDVASAPGAGRREPEQPVLARDLPDHPALAPLLPFLLDPSVTDLFINGGDGLWVDHGGGAVRVSEWRAEEQDVRELAIALIALGGRHLDDASACVDVRLEGGIRVHAVLPPVSAGGTVVSIRVPALGVPTLGALEQGGMFTAATRAELEAMVERRANLLVTGAAGAGKTTLLAALLGCADRAERIVTIEDVAELRIDHPHHVRLEARQPNLEGAGGIGLARLVREALRMRPDRLVLGECRGEEVRELLTALNTGHDGGAGTLHANGLHDVSARLEALGALAGMDDRALARQVVSAIGIVLHVARGRDGSRRISAIGRPALDAAGRLVIEEQD